MKLKESDLIRSVSILGIVFYHCVICPICIWEPPILQMSLLTERFKALSFFLMPEANMLLFVCLSGYLFAYSMKAQKTAYLTFKGILHNKINRLVIPYFIIGTLACLVVPERPLKDIIWGGGSALWFCIVLFWCTIFRWIVLSFNRRSLRVLIFVLCSIVYFILESNYHYPKRLLNIPVGILGFSRGIYFYTIFVLGECIYKNRAFFVKHCYKVAIVTFALYLSLATCAFIKMGNFYIFMKLYPIFQILFIYSLSYIVSNLLDGYDKVWNYIQKFCSCCFGIYVLHEELAWDCYYHIPFFRNLFISNPIVISTIFFFIVVGACYIFTKWAIKTKVGKYLLS